MALLSTSFSVFIVLGIYFASTLQLGIFLSIDLIQAQTKTKTLDREYCLGEVLKPQKFPDKENLGYKESESSEFLSSIKTHLLTKIGQMIFLEF